MIGIICYNKPHRKMQDLLFHLILRGHADLFLVVIPWVDRINHVPIFVHRPSTTVDTNMDDLCINLNIGYQMVGVSYLPYYFARMKFEHILLAGAGLLPGNVTRDFRIINSHPGYLPNVKGLDALKWSLLNEQPIGVTTHYISDEIDEGELIEKRIVPVYFEDTFHSLAYRVYEMEIEMLAEAIGIIHSGKASFENLKDIQYLPNRRMPPHLEGLMMNRFENLRQKSKSHREILQMNWQIKRISEYSK